MAVRLGMDPTKDHDLLWIAERALTDPLPDGWARVSAELDCKLPQSYVVMNWSLDKLVAEGAANVLCKTQILVVEATTNEFVF